MFEVWPVFDYYAISVSFVHFMEYKRILFAYFVSKLGYLVMMRLKHGELMPFELIASTIATSVIFVCLVISASKVIRNFLKLIYENKELITTIKHILEVFPEAVLIKKVESKSENHRLDVKFINNSALQNLIPESRNASKIESLELINIKIRECKLPDMLIDDHDLYNSEIMKLTDLLTICEEKIVSYKESGMLLSKSFAKDPL